jgi:Ca2+-binding EF-hand superfamily protein
MRGLGAELSAEEVVIGFSEIDADGDGRISWPEFLAWWGED